MRRRHPVSLNETVSRDMFMVAYVMEIYRMKLEGLVYDRVNVR